MTTTAPPRTSSAGDPRAQRRRRLRRALGLGLAVALAVGGMLGIRSWDARVAAGLAEALASLETAGAELDAAVADGEAALAESDGRVASEARRSALAEAIGAAALDLAVGAGSRAEQTDRAAELADDALEHAGRVRDASAAVRADVEAWHLARAVEARAVALAELDDAVVSGEELLAGTEGQVLPDNGPREALRGALDAAIELLDSPVDLDVVATVTASTGRIEEAGAALGAAVAGVTDAHEVWRVAEAERAAAEQAAATARRRATNGPGSTGSGGSRGASAPADVTGSSSGSTSTGTSGGGYWVDEGYVDGPDLCVAGDQYGNSWSC